MNSRFSDHFWLAQQLRQGNSRAYDHLVDSFYNSLCAYAYTLTRDHADAEDVVQEVFVRVWLNRKKINPNYSISSFLHKSVYNEFIDQYRKNKPVVYLEKKYLEALDLVVENEPKDLSELIQMVNSAIEGLPPKCRQIFLLNKKEGLTHVEISKYLDISVKTVEGHITRAFKLLGEKLGSKIEPILFVLFGKRIFGVGS